MKKTIVITPFLASAAVLFYIYLQTSYISTMDEMIRPLLFVWGVLLILTWPAYRITKNTELATILLVVIVLGFFSTRDIANTIFLNALIIAIPVWITQIILRIKFTLKHLLVSLNILSMAAIFACASWLYDRVKRIPDSYYENLTDARVALPLNSSSNQPDIYYIVLDGYGRADILQELYGYDNSDFINQLKEKGFVVPTQIYSNYPKTVLSVTSTLNMEYIDSFTPSLKNTGFWWLMTPWLDHNRVRTSLEKIGYTSVSISTDWSITDNQTTDVYLQSHPLMLNEFERFWLASTPLSMIQPLLQTYTSVATYEMHRQAQLYNFYALSQVSKITGPKFVFAHIILPHPPFVFTADGTSVEPNYPFTLGDGNDFKGEEAQYRDQYIAQVQFLNNHLIPTLNAIFDSSSQPPIIILQADHGPGMLTVFSSSSETCLHERFSAFSAYYLSGVEIGTIPEDISPVNLFRIIFNEYFDANLPLLENANYFPTHPIGIYGFEDVTNRIESRDNCIPK